MEAGGPSRVLVRIFCKLRSRRHLLRARLRNETGEVTLSPKKEES